VRGNGGLRVERPDDAVDLRVRPLDVDVLVPERDAAVELDEAARVELAVEFVDERQRLLVEVREPRPGHREQRLRLALALRTETGASRNVASWDSTTRSPRSIESPSATRRPSSRW
jgi:hypothetical protein